MSLQIGETFAGYRILRLLGSGGMGEVYLVQHPRLPRREALKVLRPDVSLDASFRERFIREADLAAGLRHPHIVSLHDRGEHEGQLWIAMDYIDGTDVAHLLEHRYPAGMPTELSIEVITAVASALDYAHKNGLLHRDVKPANIIAADLDTDDRQVYLADFGIARQMGEVSGLTATNMTLGTVAYAAPEQLMGEQVDGRADQYALAATLYNVLAGSQLFPDSNPAVVISRHLNASPPKLGDCRSDCAYVDDVLEIALAKNPGDRFSSCSEFARALVDESAGGGAASASATTQAALPPSRFAPASAGTSAIRQVIGSRLAWGFLGVAVIVGAVALVWRPWDTEQLYTGRPGATEGHSATTAQPGPSVPSTSSERSASSASPSFIPPPPLTPARDIAGMIVMLDPVLSGGVDESKVPNGRGGTVACQPSGASTANGVPEHTINWDTTLRVRQALTALGVRTAMTRGNDDVIGPCVNERAAMANAIHPDAIVRIAAYSASPADRGFIVVYSSPSLNASLNTPRRELTDAMHDQLAAMGIPPGHYGSGRDGRGGLAALNLAQYPAVQVEVGNVNNADDSAQMDTSEGRQHYADAIVRGIVAYLGSSRS